jgi:hypothetical protein
MALLRRSTCFSKSDSAEDKLVHSSRTICVTIDTEEEGLWGGDFPVRNCTTENLRGLSRFQGVCEKYGVPPTYLIDAPVLEDPIAIRELKSWQSPGRCEIGTHCHPWCNPPIVSESISNRESYLCNLPQELQFEKLRWLTGRIADVFGVSPTSYRAGRYGFDRSTVGALVKLGYTIDSSVLPGFDYTATEGPNFKSFDRYPCRISDADSQGDLLEVPITTGFTRAGFYRARQRMRGVMDCSLGRWTKLASVSSRLGLTRHLKLSPEGTELQDLMGLVRSSLQDGVEHLVLMLHSTTLRPGYSPYAKDSHGVERLYQRLEGILDYATRQFDCSGCTLSDIPKRLADRGVGVTRR